MSSKSFACAAVVFLLGLGAGSLWSPLGAYWQSVRYNLAVSNARSENKKHIAKLKETLGVEVGEFAKQFDDMTTFVKNGPIEVWASPDGRFVIRHTGSNETIASDLRCPDIGGAVKELVRHYSFSTGDRSFSCDFGRTIQDSRITDVQFHVIDAKGGELCYLDHDGDGRWDAFRDATHKPSRIYVRDGLCWRPKTRGP